MSIEPWAHGPDERERPVRDGDDGGDAAYDAMIESKLITIPCFVCSIAPLVPGPRQCPICAGRGYVVTEGTP
jgi:RecJ-like exonuclease